MQTTSSKRSSRRVAPLMATALMCSSRMVDRLSERSLERAALTETNEGIGSIVR